LPLFADGLKKIRNSLQLVEEGKYSPFVKIGIFTPEQLDLINEQRAEEELEPIDAIIIFNGKHLYKSRCVDNGYTIDEVLEQIESAFCITAEVCHNGSTVIANRIERIDKDGHAIRDEAVFECSQRYPSPILFSVIPRGDGRRKLKK
jgi:hypothetical protein